MKKILASMLGTIEYAEKVGYRKIDGLDEIQQLLMIGEWIRRKHGYTLDVAENERGSMNHKTEAYFTCSFGKRIPHPEKKGQKFYSSTSYQTFPTYPEALCFTIDRILDRITERHSEKNNVVGRSEWDKKYYRDTDSCFW